MININKLSVHFGGVVALDEVTLDLTDQIIGLIGPNGAGKTTLTNALSGFVDISSGSLSVDGQVLTNMAPHQRARWGLARSFQKVQTVTDLSVVEHLATVLDARQLKRREREQSIDRALDFVGMTSARDVLGAELNPFQQRMTEIARCLVGNPRLVLLDEPGGGLGWQERTRAGSGGSTTL